MKLDHGLFRSGDLGMLSSVVSLFFVWAANDTGVRAPAWRSSINSMPFVHGQVWLQKAPALHASAAMEFVKSADRLHPFTISLSKPAVAFGGMFRIIDVTL